MKGGIKTTEISLLNILFIVVLMGLTGCSSLFAPERAKKLSENFYYAEAVKNSDSVNNKTYKNLLYSAERMEKVRELVDSPIIVTSWHRAYFNNLFGGGASKSAHKKGLAVDFRASKYKNQKVVFDKIVESDISFDIIIFYKDENRIHLGFKPESELKYEKRMVLHE